MHIFYLENNNYNNPILPILMYKYKLDNPYGSNCPLHLNYSECYSYDDERILLYFKDVQILRLLNYLT